MDRIERPAAGITPFLAISGERAQEALALYQVAFGAEVIERNLAQDGQRLMQASLKINGGWIMLSDEFPEHGYTATPPPLSRFICRWMMPMPGSPAPWRPAAQSPCPSPTSSGATATAS